MTLGLLHASYSYTKGEAVKLTFFAACWMAISFLHWYSNIIEEKEGPHRFPKKTPKVGMYCAANCLM